jgi:hypothetical protein
VGHILNILYFKVKNCAYAVSTLFDIHLYLYCYFPVSRWVCYLTCTDTSNLICQYTYPFIVSFRIYPTIFCGTNMNHKHTTQWQEVLSIFLNFSQSTLNFKFSITKFKGAGLAQSAQCLATDWMTRRLRFNRVASCVQTSSRAHQASCTMGTGGPLPGVKHGHGVTLTAHSHLMPRPWMSSSYTSSPPCASIGVLWDCFCYYFF